MGSNPIGALKRAKMLIIIGPYCFICNGHNVVRHKVWGVTAWTESGSIHGWVERDVCLDCEKKE